MSCVVSRDSSADYLERSRVARSRFALAGCFALLLSACAAEPPATHSTGNITGEGDGDGSGEGDGDGDGSGEGDGDGTGGDGDTGDGDGPGVPLDPGECAAIRKEAPGKGGVDVIMLLDTSGSMLHATTQVVQNLSKFIQDFEGSKADLHVVMITGSDPANGTPVAGDKSRYRFLKSTVDSKQLFTVALNQFPNYKDFMRPNAATQFVMITDDEDAIDPAMFRSQMEKLLGHKFTQHAIASEDFMGTACYSEAIGCPVIPGVPPIPAVCGAAAIGKRYYSLAMMTGGKTMSICKADWQPVFADLKNAVIDAVPLPCDYPLADAKGDDPIDPQKVQIVYSNNGKDSEFPRAKTRDACADKEGWYYDNPDAPAVISLCPSACAAVQAGGSIDLGFGCEPLMIF
ncbi:MAG: hypothetical protein QM778_35360 [Myxococcales bacterium]